MLSNVFTILVLLVSPTVSFFIYAPSTTPITSNTNGLMNYANEVSRSHSCTQLTAKPSTRPQFIAQLVTTIATTTLGLSLPSNAASSDKDKGTKSDPKYISCVSACMYECTKPKADEQKERAECIGPCRKKCATTDEQLLLGQPIKK
mmetsp:Transcript_20968/g.43757  ORF Transcript_20968/g.43757 Transcript_20968/m.43757 type:complete len:147 (+) Transcript_20968:1-441(+)